MENRFALGTTSSPSPGRRGRGDGASSHQPWYPVQKVSPRNSMNAVRSHGRTIARGSPALGVRRRPNHRFQPWGSTLPELLGGGYSRSGVKPIGQKAASVESGNRETKARVRPACSTGGPYFYSLSRRGRGGSQVPDTRVPREIEAGNAAIQKHLWLRGPQSVTERLSQRLDDSERAIRCTSG